MEVMLQREIIGFRGSSYFVMGIQIGGALVHCLFYLLVLCLKYSHLLNHVNWIYLFESYFLSVFVIIEKGEIVGLLGANKPYLSSFDDCQTTL